MHIYKADVYNFMKIQVYILVLALIGAASAEYQY